MRAAVIGLGVEGKKAFESLIRNNWDVYASDLSTNLNLENLDLPVVDIDILSKESRLSFVIENAIIDLGFTNEEEIDKCDAVAISPSIYGSKLANKYQNEGKFLCDILTKHKNIFTIGITGTNGKTTTVTMIRKILEKAGLNVLIGGNGGGGFEGYYDLILEAEKQDYDVMLIEVCDMTLDFCNYCFDFDMIGLTNIGNDHMNVHKTIENYKNEVVRFVEGKEIFIAKDQEFKDEFQLSANETIYFDETKYPLQMFGKFNRLNAGLAATICEKLDIDEAIIKDTLESFKPVEGRLKVLHLNECDIYIGKSDNSSAIRSILDEQEFYATFIGTPRANEEDRLDILNEVVKSYPEVIILFPGLEDTIDHAKYRLQSLGYDGRVEVANNLDEIIGFVAEFSFEDAIFIGGNGQNAIIEIQKRLEEISKSLNK
ncbi:MAG: UDP-N-acetylmuramoylalanine--D-glutamate ligase [Methanobacteriaceae archaeon]|nr:UDP-N-acetylmuramoylalanine--D-glutamate ligase [Methanobacteriaceae archaeon]